MRRILFTLLLLASMPALAASFVFPKGVVTDGDGAGALIQRGGQPDRIVTLENKHAVRKESDGSITCTTSRSISFSSMVG